MQFNTNRKHSHLIGPDNMIRICIISAICLLIFTGCAAKAGRPQQTSEPVIETSSTSSYYYFTAAQMMINKKQFAKAAEALKKASELDPDAYIVYRDLASVYLQLNRQPDSLDCIQQYSDAHPDHVESLLILARLKTLIDKDADITELYTRAIKIAPNQIEAYLLLGKKQTDAGDIDSAIKTYSDLVFHNPDAFSGHFYLGSLLAQTGSFYRAAKEINQTLALRPDLIEPRFKLVEIYQNGLDHIENRTLLPGDIPESIARDYYDNWTPDIQKAIAALNPDLDLSIPVTMQRDIELPGMPGATTQTIADVYQAILDFEPENIRAAIELALFFHEIGDTSASREQLAELGRRTDDTQESIRFIINEYIDNDDYTSAAIILQGMLTGAPDNSSLNYLCGVTQDGLKNPDAALACFRRVKADSTFYETSMIHIAFILREQNRTDAAISHLKAAHEAFPDRVKFILYLSSFLEEQDRLQEAEGLLLKGIEIEPGNSELHFRLGVIFDKTDRKAASEKEMRTVIQIDPDNASALNYLGYSWADAGRNLKEAEKMIKKALSLKPGDGYIIDSLGWVHFQKGEYEQALELLKQAVAIIEHDPTLLEHLGDTFLKLGKTDEALKYYLLSRDAQTETNPSLEEKISSIEAGNL